MELTAMDLLPLVRKLPRDERERLAQLAVAVVDAEEGEAHAQGGESIAASGDTPDYEHMGWKELLRSMPDVGEDSDFERRPDHPDHRREIDL